MQQLRDKEAAVDEFTKLNQKYNTKNKAVNLHGYASPPSGVIVSTPQMAYSRHLQHRKKYTDQKYFDNAFEKTEHQINKIETILDPDKQRELDNQQRV